MREVESGPAVAGTFHATKKDVEQAAEFRLVVARRVDCQHSHHADGVDLRLQAVVHRDVARDRLGFVGGKTVALPVGEVHQVAAAKNEIDKSLDVAAIDSPGAGG